MDEHDLEPWPVPRGRGFREVMAADFGLLGPDPDDAAEVWVAWYLDAHWEDDREVYDVDAGPAEDEWPV